MMTQPTMSPQEVFDLIPQEEREARLRVVRRAKEWLGTPYHHQGRVLGAGVDCGMLLLEVYESLGLLPHIDPRPYPHDWHLHRGEQVYLGWVEKYARPVTVPLPGDLVLYRMGLCLSHGAIVIDWPTVIHSYVDLGVILGVNGEHPLKSSRLGGVWSVFGERP